MGANDGTGDENGTSRRGWLATLGAAVTGALAGCRGDDGEDAAGSTPLEATGASTRSTTASPSSVTNTPRTESPPVSTTTGTPVETWDEGGPADRSSWRVTFQDDFRGGELDTDRWGYGFGPGNPERCEDYFASCVVEDQVWVDADTDRLVIETDDDPYRDMEYRTATINTSPSCYQEFGYFEAKSRVPAQPGGQPAFWAWTDSGAGYYRSEIDFYEVFGADATHPSFAMHVDCDGNSEAQHFGRRTELATPTDETFYVWGCLWTPEAVSFYVDGRHVARFANDVVRNCAPGDPLYVMLTTHVQPPGRHGDPTTADYPYTHEIEWVRAWQHEDWF